MALRIMIVEDEFWTAMDMATQVEDRGGAVTGPSASVSEALAMLHGQDCPDAAILDVKLQGTEVYALADVLRQRGIPFVFATAYEAKVLPARFADVPHYEKPMIVSECVNSALALAAGRSLDQGDEL
ncbi:MAG: response regulator [Alphaproteobacteria bacterium]|nr:response regulator [Alphaproteobacteria bacterium]